MRLPDHEISRLCVAGMIAPFDPALINPASLDVRLGDSLLIESVESPEMVPYPLADHSRERPYLLVPGQFVLAPTMETFNLPDDISAQFMLKSSRAREGLQHLMAGDSDDIEHVETRYCWPDAVGVEHLRAGYCDPGWHGSVLTLELTNVRQLHPVKLWPGMKIGQIVFTRMESAPWRSYAVTGRYNGDATVQGSKG